MITVIFKIEIIYDYWVKTSTVITLKKERNNQFSLIVFFFM